MFLALLNDYLPLRCDYLVQTYLVIYVCQCYFLVQITNFRDMLILRLDVLKISFFTFLFSCSSFVQSCIRLIGKSKNTKKKVKTKRRKVFSKWHQSIVLNISF